jgi:hypothetical protein
MDQNTQKNENTSCNLIKMTLWTNLLKILSAIIYMGTIVVLSPGPYVIKLFTAVIYCHYMVILSFCVIKKYYCGNYRGMAINYDGMCETNLIKHK